MVKKLSINSLYQIYKNKYEQCGHVWLFDDIRNETFTTTFNLLNEYKEVKEIPAVIIHISSDGGNYFAGSSLFNLIRFYTKPVIGVVEFKCASAATDILLACDLRLVKPLSRLLVHQHSLQTNLNVKTKDMKRLSYSHGMLYDHSIKIMTDFTKLNKSEVKELMKRDKYISAQEAVKIGLVDRIIKDRIPRINQSKKKDWGSKSETISLNELALNPNLIPMLVGSYKKKNFDYVKIINGVDSPNLSYTEGIQYGQLLLDIPAPIEMMTLGHIWNGEIILNLFVNRSFISKYSLFFLDADRSSKYGAISNKVRFSDVIQRTEYQQKLLTDFLSKYTQFPKEIISGLFTRRYDLTSQKSLKYGLFTDYLENLYQ